MKQNEISFISSRNRGLTPDLRIVKKYISKNIDNVEFKYFTSNENVVNRMVKKGVASARKEFSKHVENVICADGSLPGKFPSKDGKRVLISVPYDYQFKAMNMAEGRKHEPKKKTFKNFTHIIAGSPFGKELIEKCYKIPNAEIIDNICMPFAWDMNRQDRKEHILDKFEDCFPAIKGKKVLAILLNGKIDKKKKNPFTDFDWKKFFSDLGNEWFVFTNSEDVMENMVYLDNEYEKCFGYVNKMLDAREILYFADCLVTNSGMYASYLASRKKPVYCMHFTEVEFEKYVKRKFPELCVKELNKITDLIKNESYTDENKKFSEYFSYDPSVNPCDEIIKIFN